MTRDEYINEPPVIEKELIKLFSTDKKIDHI